MLTSRYSTMNLVARLVSCGNISYTCSSRLSISQRNLRYLSRITSHCADAAKVTQISLGPKVSLQEKTSYPLPPLRRLWTTEPWWSTSTSTSTAQETSPPPKSEAASNGKEECTKTATSEVEKIMEMLKSSEERCLELEDKYRRSLAENENLRQRMNRQIEDAKLFGIQGFCKDLLEVADILSRATESIPMTAVTDENPHLKGLYEGLKMTEAQLHKVFARHGLHKINPVDEKFNPNEHEALFEQAVDGKEPGTVALVTKIGYKLHSRTIRPALVGVVKAKS